MKNKLLSFRTLFLAIVCLILNIILARIISALHIPLFLDSVGTILAGALGGVLPGIAVGFITNFINSVLANDPVTSYYGIISILIAIAAALLSKRGCFKSLPKALLTTFVFTAIGGGLGSVMTWVLYGFNFGNGISAPFAYILYNDGRGLSKFFAQFVADMAIDFADKLITMAIVFFVIVFVSRYKINEFPLGYIYNNHLSLEESIKNNRASRLFRKHSLRTKITSLVMAITIVLSLVAVIIGVSAYRDELITKNKNICQGAAELMKTTIDGDKINEYLKEDVKSPDYLASEKTLYEIRDSIPYIQYMYVYKIEPDGCHVVFDLDTESVPGEEVGTVIGFDQDFKEYLPDLFAGHEIEPVITNGEYGWLLTVYIPIRNSAGECMAYAAADISMANITYDLSSFFIRIVSALFIVFIAITVFSIWYCERKIIEPIGVLVGMARTPNYLDTEKNSPHRFFQHPHTNIHTGDELEELYDSMKKSEKEISGYVSELNEKNSELAKMQQNIITTLAEMVESRDDNTGEHIQRTSAYVRIIGERLLKNGYRPAIVTRNFVEMLVASSPLHDIGKIVVSDAILNKPGKLTPEEFDKMKTHTTVGKMILQSSLTGIRDGGYIEMASIIAESHHEKWDGSGYPHGLAGEDIPLAARIMAVADVFDALTAKRVYKEAMTIDASLAIIREEAGTHFDPNIVIAFLDETDAVRAVAKYDFPPLLTKESE